MNAYAPFGENLAQSIARLDHADAIYFQTRAKDNASLAAYARDMGALDRASDFQRAAAYFASEGRRSLSRLIEASAQ